MTAPALISNEKGRISAILNSFSEVGGRPCPDVLRGGLGVPVVAAVLVVATRAVSVCPQSVAWHVNAGTKTYSSDC